MKTKQFIYLVPLLCLCWMSFEAQEDSSNFIVVLDAGHGGKDPGRPTNYGYKEKDIALDIVLRVGKNLENLPGIKVVYTRTTDVFLELRERAAIANRTDADLFISVHCNAHHSQAYGTETYVLGLHRNDSNFRVAQQENEVIFLEDNYEKNYEGFDPNSPESMIGLTLMQEDYLDQSILLARYIQDDFTNRLQRKNRGVKQAGFWVLHNTYMPSVLIETGFITNRSEGDYLNSSVGKRQISKSITDAVLKYKSSLKPSSDVTNSTTDISDTANLVENITFKVQIAAGKKRLAAKPYNFKGLKEVMREKVGKVYRYFYGQTSSYEIIKKLRAEAVSKGYSSAFIVAYKNGLKVPLDDVVNSSLN